MKPQDLLGLPIWQPENNVNIWNLLWLSRQLNQKHLQNRTKNIYKSTFPNTLTSNMAKHHDIGEVYIFRQTRSKLSVTHRHNSEIQNALLSWKVEKRNKFSTSYARGG